MLMNFMTGFIWLHGIYGHALKTLTRQTSHTFGCHPKRRSIGSYYSKLIVSYLLVEEVESMLVNQFKRAQSNLQEVGRIQPKITNLQVWKKTGTDNFQPPWYIWGQWNSMDASGKELWLWNSYEFEELEGRTLAELEGLGVISRFDDGNLISKFGTYFVKFNVGTTHVFPHLKILSQL
jgi:hypothetical protein